MICYKEFFIEIYGSIDRSKDMVTEYKKKTDTCDNINLSNKYKKSNKCNKYIIIDIKLINELILLFIRLYKYI